jgi:hypothetical protein
MNALRQMPMNHIVTYSPSRAPRAALLAFGLLCAWTAAQCQLAAADSTNAAAPRKSSPTRLGIPPEWKITDEPRDYVFEGLPLSEVVLVLQDKCKHEFDALIPRAVQAPGLPVAADGSPPPPQESIDAGALDIKLRLKNVTIPEVFQAMNMLFEIEHTPVRWELTMNGHRPVAMLRPVELRPPPAPPNDVSDPVLNRTVVYVGNLLGAPEAGGMKPETLCATLEETAMQTFPSSKTRRVQFHKTAELLVLSGTPEEVRFMREVLEALTEKASFQRKQGTAGAQVPAGKR